MGKVSSKVAARVAAGLKKFQPLLDEARKRDLNESDTVTLVTDIVHEVLGYEKYGEITSEHAIRSTFCDLAIRLDGELVVLIEVKAVGLDLKDNHIRQAVDYAANQGCEWVALTNGIIWHAYQVAFSKPIQAERVLDLDLLALNHRRSEDVEMVSLLSREAWQKSRLGDYAAQKQALSRFTIAATLLGDPCLQVRDILKVRNAILDGEVVAIDDEGHQNFRSLMSHQGHLHYAAFDLLWPNGKDFRHLPLTKRSIVAKRASDPNGPKSVWFKIKNRLYSQSENRFERAKG